MESVTFNRLTQTALCFMCKKNRVPLALWNKPCDDCKKKLKAAVSNPQPQSGEEKAKVIPMKLGKKLPAARLEKPKTRIEPKKDIYVDKYGREVENPGYDPINDPRGWQATGTINKKFNGTLIY